MLAVIFVLTIIDLGLTYFGVKTDLITESNPILQTVFHTQPEMTFIICTLLAMVFVLVIWKYGSRFKYVKAGMFTLIIVKTFIIFTHVHWIAQVI